MQREKPFYSTICGWHDEHSVKYKLAAYEPANSAACNYTDQ